MTARRTQGAALEGPSSMVVGGAGFLAAILGYLVWRGLEQRRGAAPPAYRPGPAPAPGPLPVDVPLDPGSGGVPKGLTPQFIALARQWAAARALPLSWVLATILNESGGNPDAVGDQGRSIGLMQVNAQAHTQRLARKGLTRESLFDPATNIAVGTEILREMYDGVTRRLMGRTPPNDVGLLTRLAYRGPAIVWRALEENPPRDPLPTFPDGYRSLSKWTQALTQVGGLAGAPIPLDQKWALV